MVTLLSKFFIKDREKYSDPKVRRAYGTLCSIVGILLNILMFIGKYIAGVVSKSISITEDFISCHPFLFFLLLLSWALSL